MPKRASFVFGQPQREPWVSAQSPTEIPHKGESNPDSHNVIKFERRRHYQLRTAQPSNIQHDELVFNKTSGTSLVRTLY